jgi:chromosome segregation ATPase
MSGSSGQDTREQLDRLRQILKAVIETQQQLCARLDSLEARIAAQERTKDRIRTLKMSGEIQENDISEQQKSLLEHQKRNQALKDRFAKIEEQTDKLQDQFGQLVAQLENQ